MLKLKKWEFNFEIHNAGSYMRSSYASKIIKQYLKEVENKKNFSANADE